jgi:hypothetical protein
MIRLFSLLQLYNLSSDSIDLPYTHYTLLSLFAPSSSHSLPFTSFTLSFPPFNIASSSSYNKLYLFASNGGPLYITSIEELSSIFKSSLLEQPFSAHNHSLLTPFSPSLHTKPSSLAYEVDSSLSSIRRLSTPPSIHHNDRYHTRKVGRAVPFLNTPFFNQLLSFSSSYYGGFTTATSLLRDYPFISPLFDKRSLNYDNYRLIVYLPSEDGFRLINGGELI